MEISPALVDQFYEMDPNEDDILADGTMLRSGMVVLIEDSSLREDISDWASLNIEEVARARRANRWCKVSEPRVESRTLRFIGTYGDGVKVTRIYGTENAWLVKKDSFPDYSLLKRVPEPIGNVFETRPTEPAPQWEQKLSQGEPENLAWTRKLEDTVG